MGLDSELSLASLCARVGDFSIGAGVGLDRGTTNCVGAHACDHGSVHAKMSLNYRVVNGVELHVLAFDAGRFGGGDTSPRGTPFSGRFKGRAVGAAAGYRWTLRPEWSRKGQLGVVSVRTRFDYATPFTVDVDVDKTTTQPLAGLSLAHAFTPNWQLSLDYDETRFKAHTTRGSLRMVGLAAQYEF
jgi:hypothetical protein